VLTFDDGWKPFHEFAYPILKALGFTATLFIYTDFVGARSALSWDEIRQLEQEGFEIEAHSKTHNDLRRRTGESEAEHAQRMQAELAQPLSLFQRHLLRLLTADPLKRGDGREGAAGHVRVGAPPSSSA